MSKGLCIHSALWSPLASVSTGTRGIPLFSFKGNPVILPYSYGSNGVRRNLRHPIAPNLCSKSYALSCVLLPANTLLSQGAFAPAYGFISDKRLYAAGSALIYRLFDRMS
ncbi:hypothetical protein C8R46DRAFT_1212252 [Mycena filopes]|nr:hypothetical protein C8R46DRAFT_1212252 [Mycena filopes]